MTKDEALDLALEALESQHRDRLNYTLAKRSANATCAEFKVNTLSELIESGYMHGMGKQTESAITAIKQALAEPVQEPVAWCTKSDLENMAKGFSQDVPARSMRVPQLYPEGNTVLLYTTLPAAQRQWVPVTKELLSAQHPWLYESMWIAMKDGSVMTGYYAWMQGRYPDRFLVGDCASLWAFEATHVMPMNQPKHPAKLKEQ